MVIPDPKYDYDVAKLVRAFKTAILDITGELSRLELTYHPALIQSLHSRKFQRY